ncbi:MAG: hypothetical protein ICV74_09085 [Thermoleophilia bacterium]|nr:hypothetical protein [Thermoleophilia bacterium]
MEAVALALAALLAVTCVVFAAAPFLFPSGRGDALREPGRRDEERVRGEEARDRALAALKELEFDHRTGKVSDEDYRELVGPLRLEVADALRALDPPAERQVAARPSRLQAGPNGAEESVPTKGKAEVDAQTRNGRGRRRAAVSTRERRRAPDVALVHEPPPPDEGDLPDPAPTPSPSPPDPPQPEQP